jgi:hypothetical protein
VPAVEEDREAELAEVVGESQRFGDRCAALVGPAVDDRGDVERADVRVDPLVAC